MTPALQAHPRAPRSRAASDHIESSNSTANLFIGGTRRTWMPSSSQLQTGPQLGTRAMCPPNSIRSAGRDPSQEPRPLPPTDTTDTTESTESTEPTESTGPTLSTPASHSLQPSHPHQPIQPSEPTGPVLTSPELLDEPIQTPVAPQHLLPVTSTNKPDPPIAALPSPVLSTASHPSPVPFRRPPVPVPVVATVTATASPVSNGPITVSSPKSHENNGGPGERTIQLPTPMTPGQFVHTSPLMTTAHSNHRSNVYTPDKADRQNPGPVSVTAAGLAQHLSRSSPQSDSPIASETTLLPVNTSIPAQETRNGTHPQLSSQEVIPQPSKETWDGWKSRLDQIRAQTEKWPRNGILFPRISLLMDACICQDSVYLVLHQLYCQMSVDEASPSPAPLSGMSFFQDGDCQRGLRMLQVLLEKNQMLSITILQIFSQFPQPLESSTQEPWYQAKAYEVKRCLRRLGRGVYITNGFRSEITQRGFPPLVHELQQEYEVSSPVLLSVYFASICRGIYDHSTYLPRLVQLFQRNLFISTQPDQRELQRLVEEYRKIPMLAHEPQPHPSAAPKPLGPPQGPSTHPAVQAHMSLSLSPTDEQHALASPVRHPQGARPPVSNQTLNAPPNISVNLQTTLPVAQHLEPTSQLQQPAGKPLPRGHCGQKPQGNQFIFYQHSPEAQAQSSPAQSVPVQAPTHPHQPISPQFSRLQELPNGRVYLAHPSQASPGQRIEMTYPSMQSSPTGPTLMTSQVAQFQQASQQSRPAVPQIPSLWAANQVAPRSRNRLPEEEQALRGQPISAPHVQVLQTQNAHPSLAGTPLLPPSGYKMPQTVHPVPMRLGLHLADLRDPFKKLMKRLDNGTMVDTELYQYLGGHMLTPTFIDPDTFSYSWNFRLNSQDCQRFPRYVETDKGKRAERTYQGGCRVLRLRSIALNPSEEGNQQRLWPTTNTTWPSVFYVFVNDTELFVRRKVYNGKDLPLDITNYLHEGDNKITIHLLLGPGECRKFHYVFGIEVMEIASLEDVRALMHTVPASETRKNIQKRLNPTIDGDDLALVTDSINVSILDPFTAQTFIIPVRSAHCDHLECFDLETFLETRKSKSGPAPMNENWRCPICNADARPQSLIEDRFFTEMRDELVSSGRLAGASAIQIRADGSWSLAVVRDESTCSPTLRSSSTSTTGKRKATEPPDDVQVLPRKATEPFPVIRTTETIVIEID
ncbi:hypothetical protein N7462_010436 [Penicillium macrosclerotiorum]|uniref:uncharacterized protein n=1 Tax=Penicillium macrosclerotiorum TaxID=303699 RepID=UPI0025484ADF|nr:uncharacterized protein N7462_010436 [Penicillium macrosclerotiorum]KAJ5669366.1 hypothetical protein N7462_010436 [Penicillium macrosclerotiorum]